MKIIDVDQGSDQWLEYRKGKISGTMLSELYSKRGTRKIGFYQVIAERLAIEPDGENAMERGLRLEDEAMTAFTNATGKLVKRVGICEHEYYPSIINSPDGLILGSDGKYFEAVEVKCLSSARHLEAVITDEVPPEFEAQKVQYFIVNPDLKKLYFVFYDPRVGAVPLHIIEVTRKSLGDLPEMYLKFQVEQLEEIDQWVEKLAF